jgi:hypothetical protein
MYKYILLILLLGACDQKLEETVPKNRCSQTIEINKENVRYVVNLEIKECTWRYDYSSGGPMRVDCVKLLNLPEMSAVKHCFDYKQ